MLEFGPDLFLFLKVFDGSFVKLLELLLLLIDDQRDVVLRGLQHWCRGRGRSWSWCWRLLRLVDDNRWRHTVVKSTA